MGIEDLIDDILDWGEPLFDTFWQYWYLIAVAPFALLIYYLVHLLGYI